MTAFERRVAHHCGKCCYQRHLQGRGPFLNLPRMMRSRFADCRPLGFCLPWAQSTQEALTVEGGSRVGQTCSDFLLLSYANKIWVKQLLKQHSDQRCCLFFLLRYYMVLKWWTKNHLEVLVRVLMRSSTLPDAALWSAAPS